MYFNLIFLSVMIVTVICSLQCMCKRKAGIEAIKGWLDKGLNVWYEFSTEVVNTWLPDITHTQATSGCIFL